MNEWSGRKELSLRHRDRKGRPSPVRYELCYKHGGVNRQRTRYRYQVDSMNSALATSARAQLWERDRYFTWSKRVLMRRRLFEIRIIYFWEAGMFPPQIIICTISSRSDFVLICLTNQMQLDSILYIPSQDLKDKIFSMLGLTFVRVRSVPWSPGQKADNESTVK